jgi:hypothetical protein
MNLMCPYCGSNAFRLVKESNVLECIICGRVSAFAIASNFSAGEAILHRRLNALQIEAAARLWSRVMSDAHRINEENTAVKPPE